jgi:hypothetical protein
MHKKYVVRLTPEQRASLEEQIRTGAAPALTQLHARMLLKADIAAGARAWPCTCLLVHRNCEEWSARPGACIFRIGTVAA